MSQFVLLATGVLAGSMWIGCVVFILFSWKTTVRQNRLFACILARLDKMEMHLAESAAQKNVQETSLAITKDEPLSKYRDVTLPDDIDISFVEKAP